MSEANKALAARIPLEAFGQGHLEVIDEVLGPNFVNHGRWPPGMPTGAEGIKVRAAAARKAFPDMTITITHLIAEGDFVVLHLTHSGTMKGDFAGMPAHGKHATWDAIHLDRIADGKVVEHWVCWDQLGALQPSGFRPPPDAGPEKR